MPHTRRNPPFSPAIPGDWPELEQLEHPVAWFDGEGGLLRDNAAFRRRRAGRDGVDWVLGGEPRRAVLDAIRRVAAGSDDRSTVEMAAADDRWELLTVHPIADRAGTVLVELQDVTRRRLEERRLAAQSAPVRQLVGESPRRGVQPGRDRSRDSQTRPAVLRGRWLEPALSSDAPVLLLGERGAGKSHAALLVHTLGDRRSRPFIEVACADRSVAELARELLGDGLLDGAGAVERARGGTLYLDGVDRLAPSIQARLLRLVRDPSTEIRWMASLTRSPGSPDTTLRSDLLEELRQVEVRIPPLRERLDELPALVRSLLGGLTRRTASPGALDALGRHAWPGNVRELTQVLARAVDAAGEREAADGELLVLEAVDVAVALATTRDVRDDPRSLFAQERGHIERALAASGHSVGRAAAVLGVSRSTLYAKMRRHGIERPER